MDYWKRRRALARAQLALFLPIPRDDRPAIVHSGNFKVRNTDRNANDGNTLSMPVAMCIRHNHQPKKISQKYSIPYRQYLAAHFCQPGSVHDMNSFIAIRHQRQFGDLPADRVSGKVKISTILTRVANSQPEWWQIRQAQSSECSKRYA